MIKDEKRDIVLSILVIIFFVIWAGVIPLLFFFGFGGIEIPDAFGKLTLYYGIGVIAILGIFFGKLAQFVSKMWAEGKHIVGWYDSLLHDPETGVLPFFQKSGLNVKILKDPVSLFLIALILFSIISIFGAYTQTFFTALPSVKFQILPIAQNIIDTEPASTSETLLFGGLILGVLLGIDRAIVKKWKMPKWAYWIIALVIILPLMSYGWVTFHNAVYGTMESARIQTFMFGFAGTLVSILSGSVILWWVWHTTSNFFLSAIGIWGIEIMTAFVFFEVLISGTLLWVYWTKVGRKLRLWD